MAKKPSFAPPSIQQAMSGNDVARQPIKDGAMFDFQAVTKPTTNINQNQSDVFGKFKSDVEAGKQFGKEILGKEGLGRLESRPEIQALKQKIGAKEQELSDIAKQQLSLGDLSIEQVRQIQEDPALADVYNRLTGMADQGLSRKEALMQREQAMRGIGQATQTASRRMQALMAQQGLRGAVAGRQLMDIEMAGAQKRSDVERDIFLQSEQLKRQALGQLGQFALSRAGQASQRDIALEQMRQQRSGQLAQLGLQKATSEEQMRQARQQQAMEALRGQSEFTTGLATFDLGQAAKEKDILYQSGMGFAQLGSAERTAEKQAQIIKSAPSTEGGKIICTELHRQGILSDDIMEKDQAYGKKLAIEKPEIVIGYHFWARPLVRLMSKSKLLTKAVAFFAVNWAESMAYDNNKFGKVLQVVGENACGVLGKVILLTKKTKYGFQNN